MIATTATKLKKGTASGQKLLIVTLSWMSDRKTGSGRRWPGVDDEGFGIKTTDMVKFLDSSFKVDEAPLW